MSGKRPHFHGRPDAVDVNDGHSLTVLVTQDKEADGHLGTVVQQRQRRLQLLLHANKTYGTNRDKGGGGTWPVKQRRASVNGNGRTSDETLVLPIARMMQPIFRCACPSM